MNMEKEIKAIIVELFGRTWYCTPMRQELGLRTTETSVEQKKPERLVLIVS